MRRSRYIIWLVLICFTYCLFNPLYVMADVSSSTLTIQQALDEAYKSNPDLRKAELEVEKSKIQRDDAADVVEYIPAGGLISSSAQKVVNLYQQAEIGLATQKKSRDAAKATLTKNVLVAYTSALKAYNDMEASRQDMQVLKEKKRVASLAKDLGLSSTVDYAEFNDGIAKGEEGLKAKEQLYKNAVASLAYYLGKGQEWAPNFNSKAVITQYPRNELSMELSRTIDESVLILEKKASYQVEASKKDWFLTDINSGIQKRNLEISEIDLEQAKRDARKTMEQLYYSISAKENEIVINRKSLDIAQRDLKVAELKYQLGMLPKIAVTGDSLTSFQNTEAKARYDLENSCADLASLKAQFAVITGKNVYDPSDWSPAAVTTATPAK